MVERNDGGGHVAVIDIGSNSIRLVVYEALSRAPLPRFNEKSLCGLGRSLSTTGLIDDQAADCALNAVHRFGAIAQAMACGTIDLIATEALRRAANGGELLAKLEKVAGRTIRVLSGAEEAYLAARGVSAGFYQPSGVVGDLGGGSLDVAEVNGHKVGDRRESMPIGTLNATAILQNSTNSPKRAVDAIIAGQLDAFMPPKAFYLVGGSWRALARIHMAQAGCILDVPHGYTMEAQALRKFAKSVWRMESDGLVCLPALSSRRLPHIAGAALVLDRVLKKLNPERVIVSSLGLREGWLFDRLPVSIQEQDPLIEGAKSLGRSGARVPEFADALVRWTDDLFSDESPSDRRLRLAVCELSDVAWGDHRSVQAQLGMTRILQFPFVGIDHPGRAFLAASIHARYGGDSDDPILAGLSQLTSKARLQRAEILGRAILTGHRISGSVPELLNKARLKIEADAVVVEVEDMVDAADSDAVRNRLRQLAKAIGVRGTDMRIGTS